MNEIEKRAREFLAVEYEKAGNSLVARWVREGQNIGGMNVEIVINAILAAMLAAKPEVQ